MPRAILWVSAVTSVLLVALPGARVVSAQDAGVPERGWNSARVRALVDAATARRAAQLADTALRDYRATARGYLTFLAQLGDTPGGDFAQPPQVVKADQIAIDIYWQAPDRSKQRIVGRRDTLALPTDISYHRDHLGIVQNNFPDIIRLGDGDEVLDVPHPLSPRGLEEYDFEIADSSRIGLVDRTIEVLHVRVRPRDPRQPRVVGTVFIDKGEAQVVRMAFNFTRASYRDRQLEDLSVVLENGLVENRFWLPRRQEIELRRKATWLDYPARGIIRGRWEIGEYTVNPGLDPALFRGPEIVIAPQSVLRQYPWQGRVLDSLPSDVRAVTDDDVRRVQEEARAIVRAEALARTRSTALSARRVSDFLRVNRVEGFAVGAGVTQRLGSGVSVQARGRFGDADREGKGSLAIAWRRANGLGARVQGFREYREAGDEAEVSLVRNSLAAQEFGSDYTQPFDVRGVGVAVDLPASFGGLRPTIEATKERHRSLSIHATPAHGRYEPTIDAIPFRGVRWRLDVVRPPVIGPFGVEFRGRAELRGLQGVAGRGDAGSVGTTRAFGLLHLERPLGDHRLVSRTVYGHLLSDQDPSPAQERVYLGGPVSGPGYRFHAFSGRQGFAQRIEWRTPVPFVPVRLGRFGRSGDRATLAPYAHAVYTSGRGPDSGARGWYPTAGVGSIVLFDLVRIDVARGLRAGGRWTFGLDVSQALWGIL